MRDAVVIGAGLAGLAASIRLAQRGAQVTLVTKGIGGLQLGQGTIDALGYAPELVERPLDAITPIRMSVFQQRLAHCVRPPCTSLRCKPVSPSGKAM